MVKVKGLGVRGNTLTPKPPTLVRVRSVYLKPDQVKTSES